MRGFRQYFCMLAMCAAACETAPARPAPPPTTTVRLVSGFPGAGFYPLGAALAQGYEQVLPGIRIDVRGGTGSVGNAQALQRGEADIGFVFADVAYVAHKGALDEQRIPFGNLRGIAVLQVAALHVAVRAGLDARDIGALRGRRVAIGPAGSGTALIAQMVMRAYGVEPSEFEAETMPFYEAPRKLADGTLDAAFVTAAYPADSVTAALESGGSLLNIDGPAIDRLRTEYPFFRLVSIPKDAYPSQDARIRTIGLENLLVCRSDLPDGLVYDLTRGLFEAASRLSSPPHVLRQLNLEQAPATPIPLHPGAARLYRERRLGL
jgi:TRAP transporter TAXI family solute receptor